MILKGNSGERILDFSYAKDGVSKGCLLALASDEISEAAKQFTKKINPANLAEDGLETESHVTLCYGWHPDFNIAPLKDFLSEQGNMNFELGSVSRFETPDYDVIKTEVKSPEAQELHYKLRQEFGDQIENSYPIFRPHMTLGYVLQGAHKELENHNFFEGKTFSVSSLLYSPPDKQGRKWLKLGK